MEMSEETVVETHEEWATRKVRENLTAAVQRYLDTTAQERNYDNIMSLCTYATSGNATFSAEGQAGVEWRDQVWSQCYDILDDVMAGTRATPTPDELIAELPTILWPDMETSV